MSDPDRTLVLTTHSMDEAELLCTRIGIMAHGRLRCLGSQQHLKRRFGGGYILKANVKPFEGDAAASADAVLQSQVARLTVLFPGAELVSALSHQVELRLPEGSIAISNVFSAMEAQSASCGVTDWSVTQVGLEEVFANVVRAAAVDSTDVSTMTL